MRICHSLEEYCQQEWRRQKSCVTLGKFDGLHRGHLKLIRHILEESKKRSLLSVVFAIELSESGILTHEERAELLEEMGVDVLIECPFSPAFMQMSPEVFVRDILCGTLHAEHVAAGTDCRFGHRRAGDADLLKALGAKYSYTARIVEKEVCRGEEISSSRVRDALAKGDMELAGELLGREYSICGSVEHGKHLGSSYGVPTLNLLPPADKILPADGVYASRSLLPDGSCRNGMTNIGYRPTVGGTFRNIETSLFDYADDLYGERVRVFPLHYIRGEKRFDSLESLKTQIEQDRMQADLFFA